ncbi:MAG: ATP-binding protein [bacterium]
MKTKLSYKIFSVFLLNCLMIVVFMVLIMQFYSFRNFADYVNKVEMEKLGDLVHELSLEYQKHQGWRHLKDPFYWHGIVRPVVSRYDFNGSVFSSPSSPPPEKRDRMPPPKGDGNQGNPPRMGPPPEGERNAWPPPWPPPPPAGRRNRWHPPPPLPGHDPLMLVPRISLFDNQEQPVAGEALSSADHILKEIVVEGKRVGWLGLKKRKNLSSPLESTFIYSQSKTFAIIGGGVLFLAALVSFFFSRHLLRPIQQLTEGAQAIALRKFGTRIQVNSTDELGQLAFDFNTMAQTLEKYERMRQQWITDIAHELRTPLTILRGEIEALQDGVRDISKETIDSLYAEVMILNRIIHDLHELSLFDTRVLSHKKEPVDAFLILNDTLKIFNTRFIQQHITVKEHLDPDQGVMVQGDPDRLAQVFSNLFENTIRYTDPPGILRISQCQTEAELHLIIEDSAPAVPEEKLDLIFERLYRIDSARTRTNGGSGLGLAICKSIVEEIFGGKITAGHSSLGGLRVEIMLPMSQGKESKIHTQKTRGKT